MIIGRIIDSYWLYRVKRNALKSGRPPMWWMYRLMYSFISNALCQFSKANMVRQYSQKLESNTLLSKKSEIFLPYSSSSGVKNSFMISWEASSESANLPSVPASSPWLTVARHSE